MERKIVLKKDGKVVVNGEVFGTWKTYNPRKKYNMPQMCGKVYEFNNEVVAYTRKEFIEFINNEKEREEKDEAERNSSYNDHASYCISSYMEDSFEMDDEEADNIVETMYNDTDSFKVNFDKILDYCFKNYKLR